MKELLEEIRGDLRRLERLAKQTGEVERALRVRSEALLTIDTHFASLELMAKCGPVRTEDWLRGIDKARKMIRAVFDDRAAG